MVENTPIGVNLRRVMAREGLTYDDVMRLAGVTRRTVQTLLSGRSKPHPGTLRKVADGLGVSVEELIAAPAGATGPEALDAAALDADTNPAVPELVAAEPDLFAGWTRSDFAELRSRFGVGGALTPEGARLAAQHINARRESLRKARVVLETRDGPLLTEMIAIMYERVGLKE
ncbi:helix-turn-helix protein [Pirellulimonas nuda]|uniref:Helix-turn-helix protein n=1 Tax=Pirellulimonas nuda TaxID=2528009 RepID=A0A518D640_9BACT|nr:helix-turn-helix transcriptional regulator [Pirellulimonas nuda]QDU86940.1 helix-turn-helix protein [Pirellulimonas nuda]